MNALQHISRHTAALVSTFPFRSLPPITASLKLYTVIVHLGISPAEKNKWQEEQQSSRSLVLLNQDHKEKDWFRESPSHLVSRRKKII